MVDAVTDIDIKAPWRTKQRFVLGRPPPVTVTSGVVLGIRLRFHHHTQKQAAVCLAFDQPAADQVRSYDFCWTAEEGVGQGWEVLGDGLVPMGVADQV